MWSSQDSSDPVTISVLDDGEVVTSYKTEANQNFKFTVDKPKLWSPSSPTLYNVTVQLGRDEISSYTLVRPFLTSRLVLRLAFRWLGNYRRI